MIIPALCITTRKTIENRLNFTEKNKWVKKDLMG